MIKRMRMDHYSLPVQMVLSQVAVIILAAAAIGLPSIWLIRWQLDRQAWALVDQGGSTTRALLAARQSDLTNLAILTAQRPTLVELLEQGDPRELMDYLRTLQTGAGLDFVLICGPDQQPAAQAGQVIPDGACQDSTSPRVDSTAPQEMSRAWLLAAQPIPLSLAESGTLKVVVGQALDGEFAGQIRDQTGLEQTLQAGDQMVATVDYW